MVEEEEARRGKETGKEGKKQTNKSAKIKPVPAGSVKRAKNRMYRRKYTKRSSQFLKIEN